MPTPDARRSDAVANREAILDAATRVLGTDPDATLARVATEAGVARRTLYGHFASRDELVDALARRAVDQVVACVERAQAEPDPVLRLARFVHEAGRSVAGLHPLSALARGAAARPELDRLRASLRPWLRSTVEAVVAAGATRSATPPELAAHLVGGIQWAVLDALAAGDVTEAVAPSYAVRATLGALGVPADEVARAEAAL